jgi:arylsulfatase
VTDISRSNLPIPHRPHVGLTTYDAKDPDTSYPPIDSLRPPEGAPNVVVIMIDDAGFGASSAFGGPCHTPVAEDLAAHGLRFTRFHTTALCSPTRASLLTSRNHHSVGMGGITEIATSAPGYNSVRPDNAAPIAETLRLNGYSTAQFGKCHEVPVWETSPMGPFDQWPTGSGFEHFYGFVGAETNQWYPALYDGTTPVEPPKTPEEGYHFTEDLTDHAITWVQRQRSLMPDKPFYVYFAPGATHAPHHVPTEWSDKYRGRFDAGWDALRTETLARQKELGVVPPDADLTARPQDIQAWDDVADDLKPVLARQMELYAGFLEHTDHHIGRLLDSLEALGVLDETLVYLIIGDNGASAEGTPHGTFNEIISLNGAADFETTEFMTQRIDDFGTPAAYNHYAVGWAHAMNTPFQWTKQVASHFGGTRNGTIVHWPAGITARGEIRHQFHHIIDVGATILDVAGIPEPTFVNGIQQMPLHGISMAYAFDDPAAAERRETQYFEVACNRGIYHQGWTAVTRHSIPWLFGAELPALDDDVWELYDTSTDWTQAHDVSADHPEMLKKLQRLWLIEAVKYNVLPLDDRRIERFNSDIAGRPVLVKGNSQLLYGGMNRLSENSVLNLKNKSHSVTAEVEIGDGGANGVMVAQGGAFAGWSFYLHEGKPKYCHNLAGLMRFYAEGTEVVPAGTHQVRMEFAYDGGGLAKGGTASLFIDGKPAGEGRINATVPMIYSGDETCDVGSDTGTPVSEDYSAESSRFTGKVNWVELEIGDDSHDHLITPEELMRVATSIQ